MDSPLAQRFIDMLFSHNLIDHYDRGILDDLENPYWLMPIVERLIRNRWIGFGETVFSADSYIAVINKMASGTQGEWIPDGIEARQDDNGEGWVVVEFNCAGKHFSWSFDQSRYGQYLSPGYLAQLASFTRDELQGDFVRIPVPDPADEFIYLPRSASLEFQGNVLALTGDELVDLVGRFFTRDLFSQRMLLEFVDQFNLRSINDASELGELPLNIAVREALEGKGGAIDLIIWLKENGADPDAVDRNGIRAFDIAQADRNLMEVLR